MDPQAPDTDVKTQARRRLLRGSFSVPAVLAVHNGSALAAASNKFLCAIKATTGNSIPLPTGTTSDSYLRVAIYQFEGKKYVSVWDLKGVADARLLSISLPSGSVAPTAGQVGSLGWVEYVQGGSYTYASLVPTASPSATAPATSTAVLFSPDNGTPPKVLVVGFVQPGMTTGNNQGGISGSCWTSFL